MNSIAQDLVDLTASAEERAGLPIVVVAGFPDSVPISQDPYLPDPYFPNPYRNLP